MDNLEQRIKINGIKSGVFLGFILTALSIFSYYLITAISTSPVIFVAGPIVFAIFLPIFAVVLFCFNNRKKIGGFWSFKQATTGIFIMLLTAYLIQFAGRDIIFNKFVEPESTQKTETAAINAKMVILKQQHADQNLVDKNIVALKKDFDEKSSASVGDTIQGMIFSILFIFLFALIFASLFKRDGPTTAGLA
jgi:hypothetical protein